MSNYDLSKLNDKEFEVLASDIVGTDLGLRIERFTIDDLFDRNR